MPWRAWVVVVIGFLVGCREKVVLDLDPDLQLKVALRMKEAAQRPEIVAGLNELFDAVVADPAVVQRGEALFETLSADPKIVETVAALLEELIGNATVQAEVTKLAAANPGATDDQIGDLVGERFEKQWMSAPVQAEWIAVFQVFVGKLRARPEIKELEAALSSARLPTPDRERAEKWGRRIVELNGGKRPDHARMNEIYLEHAWSDAALTKLTSALSKNQVLREQSSKAAADILALASVQKDIRLATAALLSDRLLRDRLIAAMAVLATKDPAIARVRAVLAELLATPALIDASTKLVVRVIENPEVRAIAVRWYDQIRTDPTIRADFAKFLDDW